MPTLYFFKVFQRNPGQTSPEVQNSGHSGPTKGTDVLQKFFKKHENLVTGAPQQIFLFRYATVLKEKNKQYLTVLER